MPIKPGYKTTELYVTVGNTIIMILIAFQIVNQEQANEVSSAWVQLVGAIFAIIGAAAPVIAYVNGRAKVKASKK